MKTCIITGGNAGIGRCAAFQIAQKGYEVVLFCRTTVTAEKTCADIKKETGNPNVSFIKADLSKINDINNAFVQYCENHSSLDVLINNAADFDLSVRKPVYTQDNLERQFSTNVVAPFILSEKFLPLLNKTDDGRIINISSQGLMVYPYLKLDFDNLNGEKFYSPTKTYYQNKLALLMNSLTLREKVNSNISVYALRVTNVKVDISRYPNINSFLKFMYSIKSKFSISPHEMATAYTALATGEKLNGFLYNEKLNEVKANKFAYDVKSREKLWYICQAYTRY